MAIDHYSKWPEVRFIGEPNSKSVIDFLKDLFLREGFSFTIISNNIVQFVSEDFTCFLQQGGMSCKKFTLSLINERFSGTHE